MIYEMLLNSINDLQARWADFDSAVQTLSRVSGNVVPQPTINVINSWRPQGASVITTINTQFGATPRSLPNVLGLFGSVRALLGATQLVFNDSNTAITAIDAGAAATLPTLLSSLTLQVQGAAAAVQERLASLRQLISQGLQELVEITTGEGGLANLAGIRGSADDISTYPVLTQEFGYPTAPASPTSGATGTAQLSQTVQRALTEVLGRRPRLNDTKSSTAALEQSFTCKEVEGHTVCTWTPRGAIGQTELGATVTGAQASLYQRAKVASDNALPLLDQLTPLRPDADLQEVEAVRAIVRTEFIEVVNELGMEGGPQVQRVDDLFNLLIDPPSPPRPTPRPQQGFVTIDDRLNILDPRNAGLLGELGSGEVERLGDVFGFTRERVNTIEEEQDLTNFVVLRDYLNSLYASWVEFRRFFLHEKIGVFRVVQKLQELFRAGTIRLSAGTGALALYQFDRREVLRYTKRDRLSAYRRAFGYGAAPVPTGSRANTDFHTMFSHFINQVALYWRDKRISDVIRERAYDPSFGSIAIVRRAGLDLRNNLKFTSFGHLNVLRVEVMQLLDEAFRILNSDDVKRLFGADNAWDVVEEVLIRYFNERLVTSPRQRMAVAGREILRWLAQPHVLQTQRAQFEALLLEVAEYAEEWLTSAQAMGLAERRTTGRVMPWDRSAPAPMRNGRAATVSGQHPAEREAEYEV
jgi:hypothetical protein